jgi:hypothetical protein
MRFQHFHQMDDVIQIRHVKECHTQRKFKWQFAVNELMSDYKQLLLSASTFVSFLYIFVLSILCKWIHWSSEPWENMQKYEYMRLKKYFQAVVDWLQGWMQ